MIIDKIKLDKYAREGKSQAWMARKFVVSEAAVSKAVKKLGIATTKNITLETAHKVVEKNIDAMAQLININSLINDELKYIGEQIKTASFKNRKGLQDQQLKHTAEVLNQLKLFLNINEVIYNIKVAQEFMEEVLYVIGKTSPKVRNEIINNLKETGAVRQSVSFNRETV